MKNKLAELSEALTLAGLVHETNEEEHIPYLCLTDAADRQNPVLIDYNEADECFELYWAYSNQAFSEDAVSEVTDVVRQILSGEILCYGIFVGQDIELAGFCEEEFIPQIVADAKDEPLLLGGELTVKQFGQGIFYSKPLSEEM